MPAYAIGVDLGGTNLRIAAVDAAGNLLQKITTGAQVAKGRDFVVAEMTDAIRQLSAKFASLGELTGIGIGVPGILDMETGVVRKSPNLPRFSHYKEEVRVLRDHGMQSWAAFTLGYDHDTKESIEATVDFALQSRFTLAAYNILMPYPNTPLYRKLEKEGRLLWDGKW